MRLSPNLDYHIYVIKMRLERLYFGFYLCEPVILFDNLGIDNYSVGFHFIRCGRYPYTVDIQLCGTLHVKKK